ncbi:MAG: MaoC family dehydratase [Alphaproteobacteria bacterium]
MTGTTQTPHRYFEDFSVGEDFFMPSRTVDSSHFAAQMVVSGDSARMHYDKEFCRARGYPDQLASGFQITNLISPGAGDFGTYVDESLIGLLEVTTRFRNPVFRGDTLQPTVGVAALEPGRTTGVVVLRATLTNQRGETCMEGEMRFLLKKRDPDPS